MRRRPSPKWLIRAKALADPRAVVLTMTDEELIAMYPGVAIDHDSRRYWEGCAERRLVLARCQKCGHWIHFPRPMCPKCWSDEVGYEEASGRGTLFTFIVAHQPDGRGPRVDVSPLQPFAVGVIDLAEQLRLRIPAPLVNPAPGALRIGMPVRLTWTTYHGSPAPAFEPDPGGTR